MSGVNNTMSGELQSTAPSEGTSHHKHPAAVHASQPSNARVRQGSQSKQSLNAGHMKPSASQVESYANSQESETISSKVQTACPSTGPGRDSSNKSTTMIVGRPAANNKEVNIVLRRFSETFYTTKYNKTVFFETHEFEFGTMTHIFNVTAGSLPGLSPDGIRELVGTVRNLTENATNNAVVVRRES
jgi:hypothetical protein